MRVSTLRYGALDGGGRPCNHNQIPKQPAPLTAQAGRSICAPKQRQITWGFPRRFLINLASSAQDRDLRAYPALACFIGRRIWMTGSGRI